MLPSWTAPGLCGPAVVRVPGMNLGQNHPAGLLLVVTPGFLLHCFLHCQLRHSCSDLWTSALYLAGGTPSLPPKGPQVLPLLLGLLQVSPAWVPELPPPEGLRDQAGTKTCHRPNPRSSTTLHFPQFQTICFAPSDQSQSYGVGPGHSQQQWRCIAPAVSSSHADPSSSPQPLSWW